MHARGIQFARLLERLLNCVLRYLIEDDAVVTTGIAANGFLKMPGNRLPLSIQIRRQINSVTGFGQFFELTDYLLFAGQDFITRLPAVVRINAHPANQLFTLFLCLIAFLFLRRHFARDRSLCGALLGVCRRRTARGGQIADMPDAGLHNKVFAQIFIDGLRLGGRLHNDQCFTHKPLLPVVEVGRQSANQRRKVGIYKGENACGQGPSKSVPVATNPLPMNTLVNFFNGLRDQCKAFRPRFFIPEYAGRLFPALHIHRTLGQF